MGMTFKSAPEYKTIEAFVQFCFDDDRSTYTHEDLAALQYRLRTRVDIIRAELLKYGLMLSKREVPKYIRGFCSNDHDRWYGKGSERTFGGSGFSNFE